MARIIIEPKDADNVKSLLKSAVENELKIIKRGISKTEKKLAGLEEKYRMNSEEFYVKFNAGKMGDDLEYIRWAGEYETLNQLRQDYGDLAEAELCS